MLKKGIKKMAKMLINFSQKNSEFLKKFVNFLIENLTSMALEIAKILLNFYGHTYRFWSAFAYKFKVGFIVDFDFCFVQIISNRIENF